MVGWKLNSSDLILQVRSKKWEYRIQINKNKHWVLLSYCTCVLVIGPDFFHLKGQKIGPEQEPVFVNGPKTQ